MAFASNNNRVHLAPLWHLPITCVRIMIDRIQIDQSSSEDYISIYLVNECGSCIRTTISRDEHDLQGRVEYEALNTETCAARVNSIDLIVDDGQPQISAKFVRDLIEREQFNFYSYSPAGCGTQYWVITIIALLESQNLITEFSTLETYGLLSKYYPATGDPKPIEILPGSFDEFSTEEQVTKIWVQLIEQVEKLPDEKKKELEKHSSLAGRLRGILNIATKLWDDRHMRVKIEPREWLGVIPTNSAPPNLKCGDIQSTIHLILALVTK